MKLAALMVATGISLNAAAQKEKSVEVGAAPMYPSKNIIENAVNSKDHTTLVAAVKAAGLVETLSGSGPFTVFAPTNAAFDVLPKGMVDNLLKPENKGQLTGVHTWHVLAVKFNAMDVMAAIKKGGGKATMKTVAEGQLNFGMKGEKVMVSNASGVMTLVTFADVNQSNGVIHVVDSVLLPKM